MEEETPSGITDRKEAVFKPQKWDARDISLLDRKEKLDKYNKIGIDDLHHRAYFSDMFTHRSDWILVAEGELVEVNEEEAELMRKSMEREVPKRLEALKLMKSERQIKHLRRPNGW